MGQASLAHAVGQRTSSFSPAFLRQNLQPIYYLSHLPTNKSGYNISGIGTLRDEILPCFRYHDDPPAKGG